MRGMGAGSAAGAASVVAAVSVVALLPGASTDTEDIFNISWTKKKRVMPATLDTMLRRQMERAYGRGREPEPLPTTKAGDTGHARHIAETPNGTRTRHRPGA